jgi:hypothetical protein
MMTLDEIIGDIVYISFRDVKPYEEIGITDQSGHFLVKGHDHMGVWILHPGLVSVITEDKKGNKLPKKKQIREEIKATFLITWDNIVTIMHYPDREGYDFPSEFDKPAGFVIENNNEETG